MKIFSKTLFLATITCLGLISNACKEDKVEVTVTTFHVTNISPTSGVIRGTAIISGPDEFIESGLAYSTTLSSPKITNSRFITTKTSLNDFTLELKDLSADSTYRFRAFARTTDSVYYGTAYSFKPTAISIETIPVNGGTFNMGATSEQSAFDLVDENPAHSVTVSSFQIGKYEVTNKEYILFLNSRKISSAGACITASGVSYILISASEKGLYYNTISAKWAAKAGYENLPVVNVSWYGANEFCLWAGGKLPTEAEWEFAARGGISTHNYIYSGSNTYEDVAWYIKNIDSKTNEYQYNIQPKGLKTPNELGLYDMSGNAWEWVADWYSSYTSKAQTNPVGLTDNEATAKDIYLKVRRGGGWANDASYLRVSARSYNGPSASAGSLGFRFAKAVK